MSIPQWLQYKKVDESRIAFDGKELTYHIIDPSLNPDLPNFVGLAEGMHLFISEEVPLLFREYWIYHEIWCRIILKGEKDGCLKALRRELARVPDQIKREYIHCRLNFFRALVEFQKDSEDEDLKREIAQSLAHLERVWKNIVAMQGADAGKEK